MINTRTPENIEPRFAPPDGWQWGWLPQAGYEIRYGWLEAGGGKGKAQNRTVVLLQGLSEFCEKYFETAREIAARGYNVVTMDWRGQGASTRYIENTHKRHSQGFVRDAQDLLGVVDACPVSNNGQRLYMLAHSMGSNIGLHATLARPEIFDRAALAAPLLGLRVFEHIPEPIPSMTLAVLSRFKSQSFTPGGADWTPEIRDQKSGELFSNDPQRSLVHNAWMLANPDLQVGFVSNQWLADAHKACGKLGLAMQQGKITTPCLIASAGHENFVSNTAIRHAAKTLPHAEHRHYPEARHEILMESDGIRNEFMSGVFDFFEQPAPAPIPHSEPAIRPRRVSSRPAPVLS